MIVAADPAALAQTAADRLIARIVANGHRAAICLSGGSSPKQMFELLATEAYRSRIPWDRVHWFIGDERFVPVTDPHNNMGDGAQGLSRSLRTTGQRSSDSRLTARAPRKPRRATSAS